MSVLGPGSELDGRYRIVERRGAGSMGVVYLAEDIWLNRPVAIKMIDTAHAGDEEASAKAFWQEARSLAQIRHENVVHVYTFGKHEGTVFFAMEWIDGVTLEAIIEEHLARGETVDLGRSLLILRAIGAGLGAVHERNLVHRDVKPGNIIIEKESGRPVLVDFGLARRAKSSSPRATQTAGTPLYMPPEQARDVDGTRTTEASDLYAFACTAFELFTGRPLFEGEDIYEVLSAHLNVAPPLFRRCGRSWRRSIRCSRAQWRRRRSIATAACAQADRGDRRRDARGARAALVAHASGASGRPHAGEGRDPGVLARRR